MATFSQADDLQKAEFRGVNLSGARFVESDLSGVVMRGVDIARADIDAPWLFEDGNVLLVNGVDVAPFVDAELNRRFPGRAERRAEDPDGLRAAWAALERTWAATLDRVAAMPAGTVDISVGGEWSFAQTLRHLVHATDMWLGRGILELEQPFHPLGLTDGAAASTRRLHDGHTDLRRGAPGPGRPRGHGARLSGRGHAGGSGCRAQEPAQPGAPGNRPLVPACDPRGGVGAPPVRRSRPRRDRGKARRLSRHMLHTSAGAAGECLCAAEGSMPPSTSST